MFYYLVADIDSVLIYDGSYRKRISITDIYGTASDLYAQWIEGIGSTNGLLFPLGLFPMNGSNNILGCLSQNDAIIYFNNSGPFDRCYPSNASIDENIPLPLQNISPNPFTTSTQITLDKTYHHISLSLYDIQGKLMMEKEYADCNQIQLNRNGLNNGMYFIKLTLDYRWVETGKIVVSE
jgi:hypothetical protein